MKKIFDIDKKKRIKTFLERIKNDINHKIDELVDLIPNDTLYMTLTRYLWKKIDDINKLRNENNTNLNTTKIFFMESKLKFLNNRITSAHNLTPILHHSQGKSIKYEIDINNEERKNNLIPKFSFKEKELDLSCEENIIKELKKIDNKNGNLFNEYLRKKILSSKNINTVINNNNVSFIKELNIIYNIERDKREINYNFKCIGNKDYFDKYTNRIVSN